jgi:hypothetical protein
MEPTEQVSRVYLMTEAETASESVSISDKNILVCARLHD